MSKSFRYVKEFEFPSANNYCYGGKAMKKAEGGTVSKPVKPAVKVEKPVAAGKREGYMRSHPAGSDAARMIARNERVMENRPHKAERLGAVNAALKKNPNMTREQVADLNDSMGPKKNRPAPNIVKKAEGGDVTYNEAGQKLYVSRPANQTTAVSTTATKTLSKKDQRRATRDQEKVAKEKERMVRRADNPGRKVLPATAGTGYKSATGTTGTTTTAAKARGGVMKKADGGSVRPPLRAASQPLPTRQYSSATREYTPAENQQRAIDRRKAMDAKDVIRQKAHDARIAKQKARRAIDEPANEARKGMNKPGTAANAAKLAGTLSDKKSSNAATTASAAMAKAHGGVAHKGMTKASRGGVPAHSNSPMVSQYPGGLTPPMPYYGKKNPRR